MPDSASAIFHDFFNYAGIHRNVWLNATPKSYVEDVTVLTRLDGTTGTVTYAIGTQGADGSAVHVTLRDSDGEAVAACSGVDGTLR